MAKSAKKTAVKPGPIADESLDEAIEVFARGDYLRARALLAPITQDPERSEGARQEARDLIAATRLERGTFLTGLACLGLLAIVLVVTALTQP